MNRVGIVFFMLLLLIQQSFACEVEKQEGINKQNVIAFYNAALNDKDFDKASKYLGSSYKQHNPMAEDGIEGFKKFITMLKEKYPKAHNEIEQIFADGNYIILHVHSVREPNTRGRAIVDIYRLDKGKIVEHWDVIQNIPEKSANKNGMF